MLPMTAAAERVPFSDLFHEFGWNFLGAFTYDCGLPWIVGSAGTYAMVDTGIDWKWNRFSVRHGTVATIGSLPGVIVGSLAPIAVPLALYLGSDSAEYQLTGLALGQAAILGMTVTSSVKAFTGRVPPHIQEAIDGDARYQEDYSQDFRFGFMRGGVFNGWPSGHTATATAMATTLATLYPNSEAIRWGGIAYSAVIGLSMSFRAHWASDVFAGYFVGYAIGRNVGESFNALKRGEEPSSVQWILSPTYASVGGQF